MREISVGHLRRLTDDFAIWQHTEGAEIDRSQGYALDDSARALIAALEYGQTDLAETYLFFIERACRPDRLINFFSPDRQPLPERSWSPDAVGETYWALARAIGARFQPERCHQVIDTAILPRLGELRQHSRTVAYLAIGASDLDHSLAKTLADQLLDLWRANQTDEWPWPENELSYANAILPHALLAAAGSLPNAGYQEAGLRMLAFLNSVCQENGVPSLIGNQGWYVRGAERARFAQQPIDAAYQILANLEAYRLTADRQWLARAEFFLGWFWGQNLLGLTLIQDDDSCADGLESWGISKNRGAENVACYLMAQAALAGARQGQ